MIVMVRCLTIWALFVAGLPPLGIGSAERGATAAPAPCCCCPANKCRCGCDVPAPLPDSQDDAKQNGPGFCGCDDTPVNMPPASPSLPKLVETAHFAQLASVYPEKRGAISSYDEHLAHGPPQVLASLSTVILLT